MNPSSTLQGRLYSVLLCNKQRRRYQHHKRILRLSPSSPSLAAALNLGLFIIINITTYFRRSWCPPLPKFTIKLSTSTDLMGPWKCTQGFLPLLQKSPHARIVNASSGAGLLQDMSSSGTPAYSVSKAALNALTINAVCSGWVVTDMGGPRVPPVSLGGESVLWAILLDKTGPTAFFVKGNPLLGKRLHHVESQVRPVL